MNVDARIPPTSLLTEISFIRRTKLFMTSLGIQRTKWRHKTFVMGIPDDIFVNNNYYVKKLSRHPSKTWIVSDKNLLHGKQLENVKMLNNYVHFWRTTATYNLGSGITYLSYRLTRRDHLELQSSLSLLTFSIFWLDAFHRLCLVLCCPSPGFLASPS